jgi:hypothetical protein
MYSGRSEALFVDARFHILDDIAMHDDGPDDQYVQGDDDGGPEGMGGQEGQLTDGVEADQEDRDDASPRGTSEQRDPGEDGARADNEVDPAHAVMSNTRRPLLLRM